MLDQVFLQGRLVFCCLMFPAVLYSHAGLFFFFFPRVIYLFIAFVQTTLFLSPKADQKSIFMQPFFFLLVKHKIIKSLQHLIHNQHRETNKTTEVKKISLIMIIQFLLPQQY